MPSGVRDAAQSDPLVLRSPAFELYSGQIIAHLLGGTPGNDAVLPANFSSLSGASISTSTASPGDTSYIGIALRRDSDGAYLLNKTRTSNSSSSWQQVTFTEEDLAPIIAGNPAGTLYTLDLIDTAHGTFGSVVLDTTTIPSASATSLVSGGGQWSVFERRQVATTALDTLAKADALLALPTGDAGILSEALGFTSEINYFGEGAPANGHFGSDSTFLGGDGNRFAMQLTGQIEVVQPGLITFGFFANDGGRLKIDGNLVAEDNISDFGSDTLGTINLAAGLHNVEFVYFENGSGENVELYVATTLGAYTSMNQASFELLRAVPEPSSCLLAVWGMVALAVRRKR